MSALPLAVSIAGDAGSTAAATVGNADDVATQRPKTMAP